MLETHLYTRENRPHTEICPPLSPPCRIRRCRNQHRERRDSRISCSAVDETYEGLFWWGDRIEKSISGSCPVVRKAVESAGRVRKEEEKALTFSVLTVCAAAIAGIATGTATNPIGSSSASRHCQDTPAALCIRKAGRRVAQCHALLAGVWVYLQRERRDKAGWPRGGHPRVSTRASARAISASPRARYSGAV